MSDHSSVEERPVDKGPVEAPPRRSLAELIAAVQKTVPSLETVPAPEAAANSETPAETAREGTPLRRGTGRAANGTHRFKGVMVEFEPAMVEDLDAVAGEMRRSRSDLIREAVRCVWLEGNGRRP